MLISFPLAGIVIASVKETSYTEEKTLFVEDVAAARAEAGVGALGAGVVAAVPVADGEKEATSSHGDVKERIDE